MTFDAMNFVSIIIIAFSVVMLLAGIFTAYFGTGKSRTVGFILLLIGVIVGGIWIYLCSAGPVDSIKDVALFDVILDALVDFAAILVGAIVAVAVFLVAVMKS